MWLKHLAMRFDAAAAGMFFTLFLLHWGVLDLIFGCILLFMAYGLGKMIEQES